MALPTGKAYLDGLEPETCPICYEIAKSPTKTTCGHLYCHECLKIWLASSHTCPTCRTELFQPIPRARRALTEQDFRQRFRRRPLPRLLDPEDDANAPLLSIVEEEAVEGKADDSVPRIVSRAGAQADLRDRVRRMDERLSAEWAELERDLGLRGDGDSGQASRNQVTPHWRRPHRTTPEAQARRMADLLRARREAQDRVSQRPGDNDAERIRRGQQPDPPAVLRQARTETDVGQHLVQCTPGQTVQRQPPLRRPRDALEATTTTATARPSARRQAAPNEAPRPSSSFGISLSMRIRFGIHRDVNARSHQ